MVCIALQHQSMDTRQRILTQNFQAIHIHGFQGTRTDKVAAELGITKGAFYHYFPDKLSLGYAIVDELLFPMYVSNWQHLPAYNGNPIDGIIEGIERLKNSATDDNIAFGCPLNNLIQEMSPIDEPFRKRLMRIVDTQIQAIRAALEVAKAQELLAANANTEAIAYFVIAGIEGSYGIGKSKQSLAIFQNSMNQLIQYLHNLKA